MSKQPAFFSKTSDGGGATRREFLGNLAATAASTTLFATAAQALGDPAAPDRKIKLGLVGCGERGSWIAKLFQQQGGYEIQAAADYFPHVVAQCGDQLGVAKERRFSGLSGYQKVIASGVEAVALIVPPGFLPEHASAAAAAGLHVYMAKPVAVDVPGCLRVEAAAKLATQRQRAFLVDYQLPTDPANLEVARRVHQGLIGPIGKLSTFGHCGGCIDPPVLANIENRLQHGSWNYTVALGGSWGVAYDIHAVDAVIWLLGKRPVAAMADSRRCRADAQGDSHDVWSVVFQYADGLVHEHSGHALPTGHANELSCRVTGLHGYALLTYLDKARCQPRKEEPYAVPVGDIYTEGAQRNIAAFHQNIRQGNFTNPTAQRAVDGCLTCILGREAGFRHGRLTMEELLKENKAYPVDTTGLKV